MTVWCILSSAFWGCATTMRNHLAQPPCATTLRNHHAAKMLHPHMLTPPTSKVMPIDFTLSKIIGRGRVIRLAASFNTGDSYLRNSLKHKYVPIFLYSLLAPTMAA